MKLYLILFAAVILVTQLGCDEKKKTDEITVPDSKESELPDSVYINVVQIPQNDNWAGRRRRITEWQFEHGSHG